MDIANISTAISQFSLSQDVSIALVKKTLDVNNESSQSLIKMIDNVNPNLGSTLDVRA